MSRADPVDDLNMKSAAEPNKDQAADSSSGFRKWMGFLKNPDTQGNSKSKSESNKEKANVALTAEALENHQKWLEIQNQSGGVAPPMPPTEKEDHKKSTFSNLLKKKSAQDDDIYMTAPPPPPGGTSAAQSGGGGDRMQNAAVRQSITAATVMTPSKDSELTDAMFQAPASSDMLDQLAGGGGGGEENGAGEEEEDGSESEGVGTGSESEESEAEGEFKGGKGDMLTSRYKIEKEVGRGTFGRVLRCIDSKAASPEHEKVAIKVVHDAGRYYELSLIEAEILRDVNGAGGFGSTHCVSLLNFFKLDGHACMVFETLGSSLYEFLKSNEYIPFPLYCVQDFARQMLEALSFLHSMKLVHTDLKPENVLLIDAGYTVQQVGKKKVRIPKSSRIKLIDFGCATYDDDKHKSDLIATRQYRAPEVIVGMSWSYPSDIWSIGCIIAELYSGDQLFETHSNMEHIALIERGIEKWPKSMLNKSPVTAKYFDKHHQSLWRTALDADGRRHVRAMKPLDVFVGADKDTGLLSLFRSLLTVDPKKRISAQRALSKSFVRKKNRKG